LPAGDHIQGLNQPERRAAPLEVVGVMVHFEIYIARQEVGEEADADFEVDQLAGEGQVLPLGLRQEPASGRKIATEQRYKPSF
jgi:hypothetical protein